MNETSGAGPAAGAQAAGAFVSRLPRSGYEAQLTGTLGGMSVWQYAQLTISLDAQDHGHTRTILWHGPAGEIEENLSGTRLSVLQLLNKVGKDGWELTSQEEHRPQSDEHSYWDAPWALTTYTFKRRVR